LRGGGDLPILWVLIRSRGCSLAVQQVMPRLFTGLEIPSPVVESLAMMRGGLPGARWIDPENYHLTLRFIGDIDDALARDIAAMLDGVQRGPFELRLDGLSSFGGRKPRAVVAAATQVAPLMELQAEHERLLQRLGLEPEGRKYTPHVTLARLRDTSSRQVADYLAARGHYRSSSFQVSRFVLFSSRASVGGGPYVVEADYPLDQPGSSEGRSLASAS
jgi:RNA 2',3'-cyclic 3'-phosphodiesterase